MSFWNNNENNINEINLDLDKLSIDNNLSQIEIEEFSKILKSFDENKIKEKISKNPKILELIKNDYFKFNLGRLWIYSKNWVNINSFDNKLLELWFDLWNDNEKDLNRFLAIIKLQKTLWIEVNWIINLSLIQNVFPNIFRTRNKLTKEFTAEKFTADLKLKLFEVTQILQKQDKEVKIANDLTWKYLIDLKTKLNEPFYNLWDIKDYWSNYDEDFDENNNLVFEWIWDIYSGDSKVTNCAWINRETLLANWINWFWYTANGWKYNYTDNILNPSKRNINLFKSEKNVTEPKKILLREDLWKQKKENLFKSRKGWEIVQKLLWDFLKIEDELQNWEIISLIMDSRTDAWRKWWHMATWMMFDWKLYITDPVLLKKREAVTFDEYSQKLASHKIWWKETFSIKWIIVYDASNNKNETYLASLERKNQIYVSDNYIYERNLENNNQTYIN